MANGAFTLQGFESPEEVQARIGKAEQAALVPRGDINQMIYQTAAQGAAGMGGALAGAMGYEDPAVKKAKDMQSILKDVDMSSSEGLYTAASKLQEAGLTKQAFDVMSKGHEVRKIEDNETPDPIELTRFKGTLNGEPTIGFSDKSGNVYARVGDKFIKNPEGFVGRDVGKSEFDVGMEKKSTTKLEDVIINNETQLDSLNTLRETYRPDSLTYSGQLDMFALKQMQKAGKELTPTQKQELADHAVMQAESKANLASYIKQQSGVAASDKERRFLEGVMPSADDSETTYMAKLDRLELYTKNNLARSRWLLKNGLMKEGRGTREEYEKAAAKAPPLKAFEDVRKFNEMLRSGKIKNPAKAKAQMKAYLKRNKWNIQVGK